MNKKRFGIVGIFLGVMTAVSILVIGLPNISIEELKTDGEPIILSALFFLILITSIGFLTGYYVDLIKENLANKSTERRKQKNNHKK